jgi:hypothetical protein
MGPQNIKAALRLQMEMFEVLHDVGRDWLKRGLGSGIGFYLAQ